MASSVSPLVPLGSSLWVPALCSLTCLPGALLRRLNCPVHPLPRVRALLHAGPKALREPCSMEWPQALGLEHPPPPNPGSHGGRSESVVSWAGPLHGVSSH